MVPVTWRDGSCYTRRPKITGRTAGLKHDTTCPRTFNRGDGRKGRGAYAQGWSFRKLLSETACHRPTGRPGALAGATGETTRSGGRVFFLNLLGLVYVPFFACNSEMGVVVENLQPYLASGLGEIGAAVFLQVPRSNVASSHHKPKRPARAWIPSSPSLGSGMLNA